MSRARAMGEHQDTVRQALLEVRELEQAAEFGEMAERHGADMLRSRHLLQRLNRTHREGPDETGADRAGMEELK